MSGAAAWLIASAAAHHTLGITQSATAIAIGTIACTGAALFPDLDCPGNVRTGDGGSTVARTFGRASMAVARLTERGSLAIVRATKTKKDKHRKNGHRTFTHTWLFAILIGLGVWGLVAGLGAYAVGAIMFVMTGVAARGIAAQWIRKKGVWATIVLSAVAAAIQAQLLPAGEAPIVLGLAVAAGCIVHTLGDMLTKMGCPIVFPIVIRGRRWYELGLPSPLAIRAGSKLEQVVLMPMFTIAGCGGAVLVLIPELIQLPDIVTFLSLYVGDKATARIGGQYPAHHHTRPPHDTTRGTDDHHQDFRPWRAGRQRCGCRRGWCGQHRPG